MTVATLVSIAIAPPIPSITLGTTQQFSATGTYTDNSTQNLTAQVTWTSATSAVASISNASGTQGLATSAVVGSTLIGASRGAVTATPVTMTVTAATLVALAITPATPSIALGSVQQFTATGTYSNNSSQDLTAQVTWTSGTAAVASISNASGTKGLATSVVIGSTAISASLGAVNSASATLTVTQNFTTASCTVPAGVTSIRLVATGAGNYSTGGNGSIVITVQ